MKNNRFVVIFLIVSFLLIISYLYPTTDLKTMQDRLSYVGNTPFAVRYSIVYKDVYNNNRRKAYLNGEFDNNKEEKLELARQPGNLTLENECVYVSDSQGQERFQFTRQMEPIDINLYPYYISSQQQSVTLLSNYAVLRYCDEGVNVWNNGVHIQESDARIYPDSGSSRFPLFGLCVFTWEESPFIMSLPEKIKTILEKQGKVNASLDRIEYKQDLTNSTVKIQWGKDNPIPTEISYLTETGQFSTRFTIFETGETPEGYFYPKKAMMRFVHHLADKDELFRESNIEVIEILIGVEALEKYPLLLPTPEDPLILDERNNKSQKLDLSFMK